MKKLCAVIITLVSLGAFAQETDLSIEKIAGMEVHKAVRTNVKYTKCIKKLELGDKLVDEELYSSAECKVKIVPTNYIDEDADSPMVEKAFYSNLHILIQNQSDKDITSLCKIKKVKITDKKLKVTFKINPNHPDLKKGLTFSEYEECVSSVMDDFQEETAGKLSALYLVDTVGTLFDQIDL